MKLWEAMLRGSKLSKQCTTVLVDDKGGRCAIGAALDGSGIVCNDLSPEEGYVKFRDLYPISEHDSFCPVEGCDQFRVLSVIIWHLNDQHRWAREDIAYWIRDNFEAETLIENNTKEIQYVC